MLPLPHSACVTQPQFLAIDSVLFILFFVTSSVWREAQLSARDNLERNFLYAPSPLPFRLDEEEPLPASLFRSSGLALRRQTRGADAAQFFMSPSGGDSRILLRYFAGATTSLNSHKRELS